MTNPAPLCPCGNAALGVFGVCAACIEAWLKAHPAPKK